MKKFLLLMAAVLLSVSAMAQTTVEDKEIKVDVGFGSVLNGIPFGVSYEQGVFSLEDGSFVTAGGYVGYQTSKEDRVGYYWRLSALAVMAQANYYYKPVVDKLDIYAGIRLGYFGITSKYVYDSGNEYDYEYGSPFAYSVHVGANYWFTDKIAVNAELGYGIAYVNLGVACKF